MSKYGKKFSFTEKEQTGLFNGKIPHQKKTETYKKAKKYFDEECRKLVDEGKTLEKDTHFWFCDKEKFWSMKMRFSYSKSTESNFDFNEMYESIFGKGSIIHLDKKMKKLSIVNRL